MAPDSLHPPPEVLASWPTPNYIDPVTHGPALTVVSILFTTIAALLVLARLWSRLFITRAPGLDDLLTCLSLACNIGLVAVVLYNNKNWGLGRHMWDVPLTWAVTNRKLVWIAEWLYVASSALVKISILLFYRRLSAPFTKAFLVATWIGIIYNILYFIAFGLVLLLLCRPLSAYWNQFSVSWIVAGNNFTCGKEEFSLPFSGALSVVGDLYSTVLPLWLVWGLKLPSRQKIALYALFGMGFIVVATGIIRTWYLNKLINGTFDVIWYVWEMWLWAILELCLSIMAASAPALKPFFRRFLIEPLSSRGGRSNTARYGYGYTISSGQRASIASKERMRDRLALPPDMERTVFGDEGMNPNNVGTAVSVFPEEPKNDYELSERPAIKMQRSYEVTNEIALDDDSMGSSSEAYIGPPFAEHVPSSTTSKPGYTTQKAQSPNRARSASRGSERTAFSGESLGKATLDSTTWPEEAAPWDPAERVKYYARRS